jgi:hypothetical protein
VRDSAMKWNKTKLILQECHTLKIKYVFQILLIIDFS